MTVDFIGYSYAHLTSTAMHKHPYWEIVLFLEGTGKHIVGTKIFDFKPKTIVCQPPGIAHGTKADSEYRDMYIVVSDFIPPSDDKIPVFMDDEENRFQTLADLAHSSLHRKEHNYSQTAQAISQAMYQMLIGWSQQKPRHNMVDLAINEMVLNFSNPNYTPASLVKNTNYTTDHFRRCFKKETGLTPLSYLISLRIEHAKKLLRMEKDAGILIKDVALLCGFSDQYYFSKLFRQKTGISPSEFQNNL